MASVGVVPAVAGSRRERVERLVSDRVEQALRVEELARLRLATRALLIALVVVGGWLFIWVGSWGRILFLETIIALFMLIALLNQHLSSRPETASWWPAASIALNFALLAFSMVGYDLVLGDEWPPQMMLRNGTFVYFFMVLAVFALGHSPGRVLWAGVAGALAWLVGVWGIARLPSTITPYDHLPTMSVDQLLASHLDPHFVDLDVITQDVIVLLVVAGILAAGVWRTRRLVLSQAVAARERANLARYFSPTIVDRLAQADEPLGAVRSQPVTVLFADVVGFTSFSEHEAPERVIAFLRAFHGRLERTVFDHGGTLDKYLGDGVMATFGTPDPGLDDAARALATARAMLAEIDRWNGEREGAGEAPVRLSIGLHHGPVVVGDIGSERRLEFAVIGDVVNVASRLEELTRSLATRLVVSDAVVQALRASPDTDAAASLRGLQPGAPQSVRGREATIAVWTLSE